MWYPESCARVGGHPVSRSAGGLLPGERRRLIEERLREQGSVSVAALEAEFDVSPMTARRDIVAVRSSSLIMMVTESVNLDRNSAA